MTTGTQAMARFVPLDEFNATIGAAELLLFCRDLRGTLIDAAVAAAGRALSVQPQGERALGVAGAGVGVAVETTDGTLVPVVRNAVDGLLPSVRDEVSRLIDAARTGRLGSGRRRRCGRDRLRLGSAARRGRGRGEELHPHGERAAGRFRPRHALARGRRLGRRDGCRRAPSSQPSYACFDTPTASWSDHDQRHSPLRHDRLRHGALAGVLHGAVRAGGRLRPGGGARLRRADHRGAGGPPAPRPPLRLRQAPGADRVQEPARRAARAPTPRRRQRSRLLPHRRPRRRGERLRAAGVVFRSAGPVTTTSGPNKGGRGIYVEDPDGNAVEVVQLAPEAAFS